MRHIHPFPARMAPEIVLEGLQSLPPESVVLDPMSGSGMVLASASKLGLPAIGFDIDPLAQLVSRANGTKISADIARKAVCLLVQTCRENILDYDKLFWMDDETRRYVDFWFGSKQRVQLSSLSYYLTVKPVIKNRKIIDILKIAISRLIVTKEPRASLARDTAHSRPHRVIETNDFDILSALPRSLDHVLSALDPTKIMQDVKMYKGDARRLGRVQDASVDCIITSPPYLNAIDYIRGHRLSLIWLGHNLKTLRKIRGRSVGAERSSKHYESENLSAFLGALHHEVGSHKRLMVKKYYCDLRKLTNEAFRVLKSDRTATYVIGNSRVKGHEIKNADLLIMAAKASGFSLLEQVLREIPENRRYLPMINSKTAQLSNRMRYEHILTFKKV